MFLFGKVSIPSSHDTVTCLLIAVLFGISPFVPIPEVSLSRAVASAPVIEIAVLPGQEVKEAGTFTKDNVSARNGVLDGRPYAWEQHT